MQEWKSLYDSKSGERGIFNRESAKKKCVEIGRDPDHDFGTNPCGEIILRDRQLCNLSEVIIRPEDTMETLREKVELAAIIGTFQSSLTNFRYVSKKWRENCEEERLLGVSMTGIYDNPLTNGTSPGLDERLVELKNLARATNEKWAKVLGIPVSKAITCVKPSGTVSLLADCSSGIHPAFYPYYIRRARLSNTDPVFKFLSSIGVPNEPANGQADTTSVVSFPLKSPSHAIFLKDVGAIEHLELWKKYRQSWCDHNPSVSINVRESEWMAVGAWVYDNFDLATGISFFPYSDNVYEQAPYEEITQAQYDAMVASMPKDIDWSGVGEFEKTDMTEGAQNLACVAPDGCAI
jgi:ribonucleoside-diphosphate reductase alpha chain